MDVLGWDNPLSATDSSTVQPCHWSNQQHEIGESFIGSTYNADQAAKGFFHFSNHHEFQGIEGCENSISNSNRLCKMVQHELAPALDSTNAAPNLNLMRREESINQYGDVGTSWRLEPNVDELCSSSSMIDTRPYSISSPFNGIMEAFTTTKVGSLMESLDCLMSLKNNAETSAKDQENIENLMFLADCRNLCEFGSGSATAVSSSSGESHNNISNGQETKNSQRETVSQASSNPCTNNNSRPSGSTSNSSKRKEREPIEENGIYPNFNLLQSDCFTNETGFRLITEDQPKSKIPRLDKSSNISFQFQDSSVSSVDEPDTEAIAQMKEMIYRAAAFRPVNLGLEVIEKPKRKNVKISSDPQTVAARQRRERVSERIRVLQKLVPGGSKMDTASMLDEAANYLKFLKSQVKALETLGHKYDPSYCTSSTNLPFSSLLQFNNTFSMQNPFQFPQP